MSSKKDHRYGIGAVAKLTGLSDHTIRVWERRYDAVVAERAANGRRVYSPDDVEKLALLKSLTDQGLSIGQIAGEDVAVLRERVQSVAEIVQTTVADHVAVAALGEFLHGLVAAAGSDITPLEFTVADSNRDSFIADLLRHDVDVVALQVPVLDADSIEQLHDLMAKGGAAHGVLIYSFGRSRDVTRAGDARIVTLRAPIDMEELRAAVLRAYAPATVSHRQGASDDGSQSADWQFSGPVAPRRFTNRQLSTLAHASTAIDCECPHHLAQLVGDLTAFEIYSAQCANRDDDDAALHSYLHRTTAQARELIEIALERVAEAEGIDY